MNWKRARPSTTTPRQQLRRMAAGLPSGDPSLDTTYQQLTSIGMTHEAAMAMLFAVALPR
jgi:hypothetical protein